MKCALHLFSLFSVLYHGQLKHENTPNARIVKKYKPPDNAMQAAQGFSVETNLKAAAHPRVIGSGTFLLSMKGSQEESIRTQVKLSGGSLKSKCEGAFTAAPAFCLRLPGLPPVCVRGFS